MLVLSECFCAGHGNIHVALGRKSEAKVGSIFHAWFFCFLKRCVSEMCASAIFDPPFLILVLVALIVP